MIDDFKIIVEWLKNDSGTIIGHKRSKQGECYCKVILGYDFGGLEKEYSIISGQL